MHGSFFVVLCCILDYLDGFHNRPEDGASKAFRRKLLGQSQPDAGDEEEDDEDTNNNSNNNNNNKVETTSKQQDEIPKKETTTADITRLVQRKKKKKAPSSASAAHRTIPTQETMIKWGLALMVFLVMGWRVWYNKQTFLRKGLHKKHESDHIA
jgi:hypothetical protein